MLGAGMGTMRAAYDVVVVGSGYGGAIAASRFARAGRSVCLLERGSERWPGEFPESLPQAARESQITNRKRHVGSRTALYDFRLDDDVNVLVGCGLGGTSLINANVALRPIAEIFDDDRWPSAIRGANKASLDRYFGLAETWLGSNSYPADAPDLPKLQALTTVADFLGAPLGRAPVNVTFAAGTNAAGVSQAACNNCGNCVSGCNVGAKNTVLMNYLPDAAEHGAEIFTERSVDWVEQRTADDPASGWRVGFHRVGSGRRLFTDTSEYVHADIVVLAAGTLGSTEIMLRSRERGLAVSDRLGERFNGNGDVLGFGYDSDHDVRAIGWGARERGEPVGPTISGYVQVREHDEPNGVPEGLGDDDLVIEEGAIPGVLRRVLPLVLLYTALSTSTAPRRKKLQMLLGSWRRAAQRTLTYLVMSNDASGGRLALDDDQLVVDWPAGTTDAHVRRNNRVLERVSPAIGADYAPEMWWSEAMGHQLITVHPLGGCVMADDASTGVVNDRGEVFAGTDGSSTHRGLHVMDGAILPRPVNTNPSLTISALAERAADLVIADRGWQLDLTPAAAPIDDRRSVQERSDGVRFTERMAGRLAFGDVESTCSFVVTIDIDDLDALAADVSAPQRFTGTASIPHLSSQPMMVSDTEFQLMRRVPERAEEWNMSYRMTLASTDGRRFLFEGHKAVRTGSMLRGWADTTTLFVTLHGLPTADLPVDGGGGSDPKESPIARGVLRISVPDLLRQLWTLDAPRGTFFARQHAKYRFARAFTGAFLPVYGGLFAEPDRPDHRPFTDLRPLRLPEPEATVYSPAHGWAPIPDEHISEVALTGPEHLRLHGTPILDAVPRDALLMLTRFQGGTKGPVLLAAGFSMRANSFAEPTVETTLTESLVEAGYDVWLFDYRASIALPSSRTDFTIDDIARFDWPAAVAEVRRRTGAETVQLLGHCVGSVTIMMSLLDGLGGVRSAVCSQFPLHPRTSLLNRFKNAVHAVELFQLVGIRSLEPSTGRRFKDRATDLVAAVLPVPRGERCGMPMCRWVNAIFGLTHTHDQLNAATHESLTAAFGAGTVKPLRHLSLMMRTGRAVDADGNDRYLQRAGGLGTSLLLIQGTKNYIFRPSGMRATLDWLRDHHEPSLFELLTLDGYAHLDGMVGTDAATDVFPHIVRHLDAHN